MNNDAELLKMIQGISMREAWDPTNFTQKLSGTAHYVAGVSAVNAYDDFHLEHRPWSQTFQLAQITHLFYDAPSPIACVMLHACREKERFNANEDANFIKGAKYVTSDYTYNLFLKQCAGEEDAITRTYQIVKHLRELSKINYWINTPGHSVDTEYVKNALMYAYRSLIPFCNKDVDAHPASKVLLETLADTITNLIK